MLKGREIKGLWVFTPVMTAKYLSQNKWQEDSGSHLLNGNGVPLKCLGRIEDFVFNFYGAIEGFLVATNGIWKNVRFLPVTEIICLQRNYLWVKDEQSLKKIKKDMLERGCKNWLGAKVFSAEGKDFATVTDVIFTPSFSNLAGLEISHGVVEDLQSGRKFLPWGEIITVEQQSVFTNKKTD